MDEGDWGCGTKGKGFGGFFMRRFLWRVSFGTYAGLWRMVEGVREVVWRFFFWEVEMEWVRARGSV